MIAKWMWGSVTLDGKWYPNPFLSMTDEEQYKANIENGYLVSKEGEP